MMLRRFVRVRSWLAPLAALFLLVPALARAASQGSAQPGALTLASVSGTGQKGNGGSFEPKLSDDGTKVAFWSSASNLTPLDNDNSNDIFVKSLTDGSVTLASTSISGVKGNSDSLDASISGDGNLVAFTSEANNLSPADGDNLFDIYVKNLSTGGVTVASTTSTGEKGNGDTRDPVISEDGSHVAFYSHAKNFDPRDIVAIPDIYVKSLSTGDIYLASTSTGGVKGDSYSYAPSPSSDGTKVAFYSASDNLDPSDTDPLADIYVKDIVTGQLILASTSSSGVKGNGGSLHPSLSGDGTKVAFWSSSTNLAPADSDSAFDIYVKDLVTGQLSLVSTTSSGIKGNGDSYNPVFSADGTTVAFWSKSTNLDPNDTDTVPDLYVKNLVTGGLSLASTSSSGIKGNADSYDPVLSSDGATVAFWSESTNLDPGDTDKTFDMYVKDVGSGTGSARSMPGSTAGLAAPGPAPRVLAPSMGRLSPRAAAAIKLTPVSGPPSAPVKVKGTNFGPSETVTVTFDSTTVATPVTNAQGAFSTSFNVPSGASLGAHTVTATGQTSGKSAQATFTVQVDWPWYRFDLTHTARNPYEQVIGTSNVAQLQETWARKLGDDVLSSPAIVGGVMYVGSEDGHLYALDATTGNILWRATTGGIVWSSPAVVKGVVYAGSYDNKIYAFDAATGAVKWAVTTGDDVFASPTVANGVVYEGSWDNKMYAINAATGVVKWAFQTGGVIESTPAVVGGTVYFGSFDKNVYAIDVATGTRKWKFKTGGIVEASSPTVVNGTVYIGSNDDKIYALDAAAGTVKWSVLTGHNVYSSPAYWNGTIYVGSRDKKMYAINATTGDVLWTGLTGRGIWCPPTLANGVAYIGSADGKVYAFDATTGTTLWTGTLGGIVFAEPVILNGVVYQTSDEGVLYAYNLTG